MLHQTRLHTFQGLVTHITGSSSLPVEQVTGGRGIIVCLRFFVLLPRLVVHLVACRPALTWPFVSPLNSYFDRSYLHHAGFDRDPRQGFVPFLRGALVPCPWL